MQGAFLGVALVVSLSDASSSCEDAWRKMTEDAEGACSTAGLTVEDLDRGACPKACQELYDGVIAECEPLVSTYSTVLDVPWTYKAAMLYHEEGHKWSGCDYGYAPSGCDVAYGALAQSRLEASWEPRRIPGDCLASANEASCSSECVARLDAVARSCAFDARATFAPDCCFSSRI